MITVGVDLSAEPAKTVAAVIEWGPASATLVALHRAATDQVIIDLAAGAAKVGIDCPLGWPMGFVDFVVRHASGTVLPGEAGSIAGRDHLAYRRTDIAVRRLGGPNPLSVSSDRIGRAAMRVAGLLAALPQEDGFDRSGGGRIVEVYPAAALHRWRLPFGKYKGAENRPALGDLCDGLFDATSGWLTVNDDRRRECARSDDAFDAVIAALNARAATLPGGVLQPPPEDRAATRVEGWIAVPTCELSDLDPSAGRFAGDVAT